ncbi:MAG: GtrA family protein [Candidatus Nanohaloarchaea archaeon]
MKLEVFKDYMSLTKFLLAGVVGLVVENGVLFLMFDYGSVNLYISKLVALEAAIITVFFINDHFAFEEYDKKTYAILRSNIVRAGGTLISFVGLYVGVELGLHYMIANTIGVGLGSMFNYYFERLKTWNSI